jgi:hypothetical protein
MANCVTCGRELHPERAQKYDYCTDPQCQKKNAKGLTILALGVNKAADHYQVLDERTSDRVASGAWVEEAAGGKELAARQASRPRRDRDRGGPGGKSGAGGHDRGSTGRDRGSGGRDRGSGDRGRPATVHGPRRAGSSARRPWTQAQQDLALIYNQQGMRPDEIAAKLGLTTYTVTQMILAGRNRPKP